VFCVVLCFVTPVVLPVIGAVMRKLVHLIYGVVRSGKPFDANCLEPTLAIQDGI
jgi:transposase